MATWITVTPRLREGFDVINQVDSGKFRLFVNRICQNLQSGNKTKTFSTEEEEKLSVSLDLDKDNLKLLLDTVTLIYVQAAYNIVKPATMETQMRESFDIQEDKISLLVQTWVTYCKGIVEALRQKSIFPTQVDDINWSLNVQSSSSAISKEALPTVILQLGLTNMSSTKPKSSLTVELGKVELLDLYNNLEKIQSQLDNLK